MIAVVGGTGTAGRPAVEALLAAGREVRILSRSSPESLPDGAEHRRLDLIRDDPAESLSGADVLLDLANSSSRPGKVLLDGTSRLLRACERAGIKHYVGISIVGCERVGLGYYKAKTRQEQLIRESPVESSLLRASQFHELVDGLMSVTARAGFVLSGEALLQPIASEAVGARLALIAQNPPLNGVEQITGPEVRTLTELADAWRQATGRAWFKLRLPLPGRTGRALKDGVLTDAAASTPGVGFSEWLAGRYR